MEYSRQKSQFWPSRAEEVRASEPSKDAVNDVFVEGMKALTNFVSVLRNCIDKKRAHLSTLSLILYAIVAVLMNLY